jgi:hypothetical protein
MRAESRSDKHAESANPNAMESAHLVDDVYILVQAVTTVSAKVGASAKPPRI